MSKNNKKLSLDLELLILLNTLIHCNHYDYDFESVLEGFNYNLRFLIVGGFVWSETQEGVEFWLSIFKKMTIEL